jgi:GntR family transcriptional regulator/MocR family aminotransferase
MRASLPILAHLPIRRDCDTPLHRQLYDGLQRAIVGGLLRPGQRIPSTRSLATELGLSRMSVLTAYEQLLHEGYLEGRTGSGTFVSATLPDDAIRPALPRRARSSTDAGTRPEVKRRPPSNIRNEGGLRPFRMSVPALNEFPHTLWARLVAKRAHAMTPALMAYGDPAGLPVLRAAVAEHLRTARAVRCEAEHVLVVSGSQAALSLCASVLLAPGDLVAVEEPGYPGAHVALRSSGAQLAPVPVDDEGIDVAAIDRLGQRVRAVYITPSHQYPLGTAMSAARREALLDWAQRRKVWLIEDDYDSEYRYVSRPLGALQGMSADGRVVYIGTFSKVMFPSIRVGYMVIPPPLWEAFFTAREGVDVFSPPLYQLALADFIDGGHFARHLRRMRLIYLPRRNALLDGLEKHCNDYLTVYNADAGLHMTTLLRPGVDDTAVVRRMSEHSLNATPLSSCYLGAERRQGLLLGFGGWDERRILSATRTLGDVLRELG